MTLTTSFFELRVQWLLPGIIVITRRGHGDFVHPLLEIIQDEAISELRPQGRETLRSANKIR